MKKINYVQWLKRFLIYGLGMFLIAVGINISIKSNLGVSAVSSLPYVLSLKFTFLSVGNWTIAIYGKHLDDRFRDCIYIYSDRARGFSRTIF